MADNYLEKKMQEYINNKKRDSVKERLRDMRDNKDGER